MLSLYISCYITYLVIYNILNYENKYIFYILVAKIRKYT
nr:MAG TPA: hypothetical protein [Caudoviricetes sp.]DAW96492.1 MAG TPA: hypothetical protein [Bacteriophage sp.]